MRWVQTTATALLLAFVAVSLAKALLATVTTPQVEQLATEPIASAPVIAYYLHSSKRCVTCRAIEENGQASLANAVRDGKVEWRVANYEEPANAHLAREFDLAFASLVLVSADGAAPRRWKVLDRAWELFEDPPAFANYVQAELAAFESGRQ